MSRLIDPRLWDDDEFLALGDSARMLYITMLAGPDCGRIPGLFRGTVSTLAENLHRTFQELELAMKECESRGVAIVDRRRKVICLPHGPRWSIRPNPNQIRSWWFTWRDLPSCEQKTLHVPRLLEAVNLQSDGVRRVWQMTFQRVIDHEVRADSSSAQLALPSKVVQLSDHRAKRKNRESEAPTRSRQIWPEPSPAQPGRSRDEIPD